MKFMLCVCVCVLCKYIQHKHSHFADLPEFSHYKHCDFDDAKCLFRIQARISSIRPPDNITGFEQFGANKSSIGLECDCPAACREIVKQFHHFL